MFVLLVGTCVGNNGELPHCNALIPAILEAIVSELLVIGYFMWIGYVIFNCVMWLLVVSLVLLDVRFDFFKE